MLTEETRNGTSQSAGTKHSKSAVKLNDKKKEPGKDETQSSSTTLPPVTSLPLEAVQVARPWGRSFREAATGNCHLFDERDYGSTVKQEGWSSVPHVVGLRLRFGEDQLAADFRIASIGGGR